MQNDNVRLRSFHSQSGRLQYTNEEIDWSRPDNPYLFLEAPAGLVVDSPSPILSFRFDYRAGKGRHYDIRINGGVDVIAPYGGGPVIDFCQSATPDGFSIGDYSVGIIKWDAKTGTLGADITPIGTARKRLVVWFGDAYPNAVTIGNFEFNTNPPIYSQAPNLGGRLTQNRQETIEKEIKVGRASRFSWEKWLGLSR